MAYLQFEALFHYCIIIIEQNTIYLLHAASCQSNSQLYRGQEYHKQKKMLRWLKHPTDGAQLAPVIIPAVLGLSSEGTSLTNPVVYRDSPGGHTSPNAGIKSRDIFPASKHDNIQVQPVVHRAFTPTGSHFSVESLIPFIGIFTLRCLSCCLPCCFMVFAAHPCTLISYLACILWSCMQQ